MLNAYFEVTLNDGLKESRGMQPAQDSGAQAGGKSEENLMAVMRSSEFRAIALLLMADENKV